MRVFTKRTREMRTWCLLILFLMSCSLVHAVTQFRTPILEMSVSSFLMCLSPEEADAQFSNGTAREHQPHDVRWFQLDEFWSKKATKQHEHTDCKWHVDPWAAAYHRVGCESFVCNSSRKCGPCLPCGTLDRRNLSELFFGKELFTVEDSLPDSFVSPSDVGREYNPYVGAARISPFVRYTETGCVIGCGAHTTVCDGSLTFGFRSRIPYKVIRIVLDRIEEEDNKRFFIHPYAIDQLCSAGTTSPRNCDWAYRADFQRAIIRYGDDANDTEVIGVLPTDITPIAGANAPVLVVKRTCGAPPHATQLPGFDEGGHTFGKVTSQIAGPLPADGSGSDGEVFFFDQGVDYASSLAKDPDAQRMLFIIPRFNEAALPGNTDSFSTNTDAVRRALERVVDSSVSAPFATKFLADVCGFNVRDNECVTGLGDLQTDIYLGYEEGCWCASGLLGLVFPTGPKHDDPLRPFFVTTGHNGHYEIRLAADGSAAFHVAGCNLMLDAGLAYNHVFKREERKAAPFQGACVRNIGGPCIAADVSWNYLVFHADLFCFASSYLDLGTRIGYELFHKGKDHVTLKHNTAVDCFGRTKGLNASILEQCTDTTAHKIRADLFYTCCSSKIFFGGSYVFAGKNAMAETTLHGGIVVSF